jgi:predicted  nucleic acid-binding Zn-ribbon protein
MSEQTKNNGGKNKLIPILAILLLLSIGANIYFLTKVNKITEEKNEQIAKVDDLANFKRMLEDDMQAISFELDQFKGKNNQLDSLLAKANEDIEQQKRRIEKLMRENTSIESLQRQLMELKAIRDQYRVQIEELIKENKELRFENINLSQEVQSLAKDKDNLSQKVEIASALKAENLTIKTYREKGKGALQESDRAKRVSRVSALLAIAENKVAPAGNRDVILRIIKPDGYVLSDPNMGSGTFTSKETGRNTEYTMKKTISYGNATTEVTFDYDQVEEFKAGLYIAEMYVDGRLMGNNKFNLK